MARFSLVAYCLGIGLIGFLPKLDLWPQMLLCFCAAFTASLTLVRSKPLVPILIFAFGLGAGWHIFWGADGLSNRLPQPLEGEDLEVAGQIVSVPEQFDRLQQFTFRIDSGERGVEGKVRLNFYDTEALFLGDKLTLKVRLNRPHSLANPGSFDREANMLRAGLIASGYLREILSHSQAFELSRVGVRAEIYKRLRAVSDGSEFGGLIIALVLGEKSGITSEQTQLFAETGTTHLFVISGLHIGLVAGVFFFITSLVASTCPPILKRIPRQKIAGIFSLIAAVLYSALAGFSLPTQRAIVMLGVFVLCSLWDRRVATSYRFLLALAIVLSLDPLAPISAGFWYSFVAVAGLLFLANYSAGSVTPANHELPAHSVFMQTVWQFLLRLVKPQLIIFIVLLLPVLVFGTGLSVLSPLGNTFAIPLVGLLIVPMCLLLTLLTFVSGEIAANLLSVIEYLFYGLLVALEWLSQWQDILFSQTNTLRGQVSLIALTFGVVAVSVLLAPIKIKLKLLALPLVMPLFWPGLRINHFDLAVHVLDVGQGLAVVIQTANYTLLYDTGFGVDDGYSAGEAVVLPVLSHLNVGSLDAVVISHGDNDHIGGLQGVLRALPETVLISNSAVLAEAAGPSKNCANVEPWRWDKARFEFLGVDDLALSTNNQSCVLRVSLQSTSILLPGDIERPAEILLTTEYGNKLRSDILIAPHHGSKSSSSYPFLKQVQPKTVIVSAGYNNRFGHPSADIIQRYEILGLDYFVTNAEGMLSFYYPAPNPDHSGPISYRKSAPRYWR
jgi:competence protein ComEC